MLAAYLSGLLCIIFVFVMFGGVRLFLRIHVHGFSYPIGSFAVPTSLSYLFWYVMALLGNNVSLINGVGFLVYMCVCPNIFLMF